MLVLLVIPSEKASASRQYATQELEIGKRYPLSIQAENLVTNIPANQPDKTQSWQKFEVKNGDSLAILFARAGLTAQDTYNVSKLKEVKSTLLKMNPGDELALLIEEGELQSLLFHPSSIKTLRVNRLDNGFAATTLTKEVTTRLGFAQGEIQSSFWNAGVRANLTDNQIMNLAAIFGWDIDFALEIRQGDHFNVIFEKEFVDGELVGYGDIVAAEFTNQGETFTAIRYSDGSYYTPEGDSMRKSFLRAPVNFKYISSNFKLRRFHPVTKRWKAHRGVDYAANTGTPVVAAGDGKVIRATYDKYNGHHVFIQHGEKYTTKYLHFSKRKVRKGQWVKQGQVIGLVGATGLASGPHLHYEFLVNGVHRNPRTVVLPDERPIDKKELAQFNIVAKRKLGLLKQNRRIMLAMN
jgi:murein DD-endopeptidase MepM/ murein hydrolase activator NlpD